MNKYNKGVKIQEASAKQKQEIERLIWQQEQVKLREEQSFQDVQPQKVRKMIYPKKEKKDTDSKKPKPLFLVPR